MIDRVVFNMLKWLVSNMDWFYLHMSSSRKGAFLLGFTTLAELILFFVWAIVWAWWITCSIVSKSEDFFKKSESKTSKGITNTEDESSKGAEEAQGAEEVHGAEEAQGESSSGAGKEVRLFGLVSVRVTWLGGLGVVHAVCLLRFLFSVSMGTICFSGWMAMLLAYFQWDKALFDTSVLTLLIMCVAALFSGLLMWAFSGTRAWKENKKVVYRLAEKGLRS